MINLKKRFLTERQEGQNYFSINIEENPNYFMATLLDPRFKDRCFSTELSKRFVVTFLIN